MYTTLQIMLYTVLTEIKASTQLHSKGLLTSDTLKWQIYTENQEICYFP